MFKPKVIRLLVFILMCIGMSVRQLPAQQYLLQQQHFSIENGLSHRDVACIYQDQRGLMWFGTKYGLDRFDGQQFKWFTKENNGLQSNEINHILGDRQGRMWLFYTGIHFGKTVKQIDIFDPIQEQVASFETVFGSKAPFHPADIVSFTHSESGDIILLTRDHHLIFYDGQFRSVPIQLPAYTPFYDMYWAPTGLLWLSMRLALPNGDGYAMLLAFDKNGKEVRRLVHRDLDFILIYDLDAQGNCSYLASKKGKGNHFFRIRADGMQQADTAMASAFMRNGFDFTEFALVSTLKKHGAFYWVSPGNAAIEGKPGFGVFAQSNDIVITSAYNIDNISHVSDVFYDKDGKIWLSTQFGIYCIQLKINHFSKILYNQAGKRRATRNLLVDKAHQLWIVEEDFFNLWKVNLQTGDAATVNTSERIQNKLPFEVAIFTLIQSKTGQFYYCNSKNLIEFDPATYHYIVHPIADPAKDWAIVWSLYEDEYGKIWFATDAGEVGFWDGKRAHWLSLPTDSGAITYIYQFLKDRNGKTWLASDGGLLTLDTKAGKIINRYWSGGKGAQYFPFDNIQHIHEDADGSFWLGTGGTGLIHWNKGKPLQKSADNAAYLHASGLYEQFTVLHGLSNNVIYAVYKDFFNNLWLSSDYGIMRFDKKTYQTQTFLEADGITHTEFNRVSHFQAADGTIYFGGLNGVTAFHPKDFQQENASFHPPLVITDYQHYGNKGQLLAAEKGALLQNATIILRPGDRFFRLEFALLSYQDAAKNHYAYKIEAIDKDWHYQQENSIRFSRLPYGKHLLRIKGQTAGGQWSDNQLAIQIVVVKPFYWRTWFLALAGLLLLASGFLLYKRRTSQLKKRQSELEQLVAERTQQIQADKKIIEQQAEALKSLESLKSRFFANVSHELRTPLTLMLGPLDSLLKRNYWQEKDGKLLQFIYRNGQQLLKLVNEILDLSKLETGRLEVRETVVHFYQFLQPLVAQFSSFGDSESVKLTFDYRADPDLNIYLDTDKFEKIAHNFLANALKFTPQGGRVDFVVEDEHSHLLIKVADTGPGIHPNDLPYIFERFYQSSLPDAPVQSGTGIGLSLCRELAELLEGAVWAESKYGFGSTFYFRFPKKTASAAAAQQSIAPIPILTTEETSIIHKTSIATTDKTSLLIVEDNPDLQAYMSAFLEETHQIRTAKNGMEAWEILSSEAPPDLIISDLMMPVMDGFQLLEKIKNHDHFRHIPIIMLTARTDVKTKLRALRTGVDDYLTKPFVEEELQTRIDTLLRNYRERMAIFTRKEHNINELANVKKPVITQVDAEWLETVENIYTRHLNENNLNINFVANQLHLSPRQLHRRLKQLTGLTPNQYLQEMRLSRAYDWLLQGRYASVKEVRFAVGFADSQHFSALFQKRFGIKPSELQK